MRTVEHRRDPRELAYEGKYFRGGYGDMTTIDVEIPGCIDLPRNPEISLIIGEIKAPIIKCQNCSQPTLFDRACCYCGGPPQ